MCTILSVDVDTEVEEGVCEGETTKEASCETHRCPASMGLWDEIEECYTGMDNRKASISKCRVSEDRDMIAVMLAVCVST